MRFVLECDICRTILNEVIDDSYKSLSAYKKIITCKRCFNNLNKLKEVKNGSNS